MTREDFISQHKELFARIDTSNGFSWNSKLWRPIIALAREHLGYSPTTVAMDIGRTLFNEYKRQFPDQKLYTREEMEQAYLAGITEGESRNKTPKQEWVDFDQWMNN